MVGFLIIHICETFVKHETKISGSNQPLILLSRCALVAQINKIPLKNKTQNTLNQCFGFLAL